MERLTGAALPAAIAPAAAPALEDRILTAAIRCVARWGLAKSTVDDVAREAGCSRATVYRVFPGGKDALMLAALERELRAFVTDLRDDVDTVQTLEDALVTIMTRAAQGIDAHPALQYLLAHEPEAVRPLVSFDGLEPLIEWAGAFGTAHLARFVGDEVARDVGRWVARVIVAYSFEEERPVDLSHYETTRRFVRTYLLPGVEALADTDDAPPADSQPIFALAQHTAQE
jgi:AcrR family transcriptional regulator